MRACPVHNPRMPILPANDPVFLACFWVALVTAVCMAADILLLLLLPRLRLSFGSPGLPALMFAAGRLLPDAALVLLLTRTHFVAFFAVPALAGLACLLQVILTLLAAYGLYIEPFRLSVTELHLPAAQFYPDRALRILQISDLHVERLTSREREVIRQAAALRPDLIVLTGDYLNLDYNTDPLAIRDARTVFASLHAPLGVYAIQGTFPVDQPETMHTLFDGLAIRVLDGKAVELALPLAGLSVLGVAVGAGDAELLKRSAAALAPDSYKLLLYHTPDLIHSACAAGMDLYLAGHTHAGQIRLPFFGAIVTASRYWKRYEAGRYRVGKTTLYVSRGIGMEGSHMPRIRFLAPPELVLIHLGV